jgi:hypothetical protein
MSDAPERIWAWQDNDHETGGKHAYGGWYVEDHDLDGDEVEYRRADLPPTDEECLRNEKVKELVEALETILRIPNSEAAQGIMKCYARAALAALPEDKK